MTGLWWVVAAATSARQSVAERGGVIVSAAFYVLVVVVLSGLWRVAADANGGTIAGYSAVALTWYIATTEASTCAQRARLIEEIGDDIASGSIAVELLRPVPVLWVRLASEMGRCLPRLAACAGAGVVVCLISAGGPPRWTGVALAVPSLLLAVACNLAAQHAVAAIAFWVRDAGSGWFLYQKLVFITGGMLIPLEVVPGWLQRTAMFLPFRAMAYAPARLASGHLEPQLLVEQGAWLAAMALAAAAAFRAGERRLQVVGG